MKALHIGEAVMGVVIGFVYVAALYAGFALIFKAL